MLKQTPVLLPPTDEQDTIARILGALDDKIELNRRMNETLESMARALFQSWFVDFDPVRARMEGRQPFGMNAETAALFPCAFTETPTGEIPQGWRAASVYEVAQVHYGAPFASSLFNTQQIGMPLIRIRDLTTNSPGVYTTEVLPKQTVVTPSDVVVGMDGEFRAYHWQGPLSLLNQRCCAFMPHIGVPKVFLLESIRKPLEFVERSEAATTVIHLGKADIDQFQVILPNQDVLEVFGKLVNPLLQQRVAVSEQNRTLSVIRDALLPKLMSGEVRVREAEKTVEAAVTL